ncbi:prepilin peptidase [Candidatus Poribacteria bacterium]|nr:prepilin peptidase [Candidatus Poribacteria bacterium]
MVAISIFIFILGLAIGSFLNVCIYRIPREGLSIHSPRRSVCPECEVPIQFYDNIPVLSYLLLRGRCRNCKTKISIVYPLVELITGGLFLLMFYRFGLTLDLLRGCLFVSLLVPIAWIDARWYIIPNAIIVVGLILGLAITLSISLAQGDWGYLIKHLIAAVAGGGGMMLIAVLGSAIFRKPAMGGGDIKLMSVLGLFLGLWPDLLVVIIVSAFTGSIVGGILIARSGKKAHSPIPYGPFLVVAALLDLVWGDALWMGYLRLIGWQ